MKKSVFLRSVVGMLLMWAALAHAALPTVEVFKSAYCGCCEMWVEHLRANGFTVKANDVPDPAAHRAKLGIPETLGSCHSAKVGDYVLEGHVPAREIKRLLAEQPKAKGLAVPGMPLGSPGMEADRADAYDVMLIQSDGGHAVYQHYAAAEKSQAAPMAAMSEGEVRKVDRKNGRIMIKHGKLANLGMPAMTMVFEVKDDTLLEAVKAGSKIRFVAEKNGNGYQVTQLVQVQ